MNKIKGTLLALTAALFWGLMGVFVRKIYEVGLSNFDITFCRCFIAGVGYLILNAFFNRKALRINLKGLMICMLYGIIVYGLSFLSYNIAVEYIPIGVATVLMFLSPIWVSLIGKLVFNDNLSKFKYTMIFICFIGASLTANIFTSYGKSINFIGIIAAIFNGIGMALQIMIPRYFEDKYSCDTMIIYGFLGSSLFLSFGTDFGKLYEQIALTDNAQTLINILVVSIASTLIANVAYTKAPKYIGTVSTSMLAAIEIVVGTIAGYVVFGEALTLVQWFGIIIIVCAITAFRLEINKIYYFINLNKSRIVNLIHR